MKDGCVRPAQGPILPETKPTSVASTQPREVGIMQARVGKDFRVQPLAVAKKVVFETSMRTLGS